MKTADLADPVDKALLPVLRHSVRAFTCPEAQSWKLAYSTAAERWGEARGLALAHATVQLIASIMGKGVTPEVNDPLHVEWRDSVTDHEHQILLMLGFMRRQDTANARDAVLQLCNGHVHAQVVRSALALAARLDPCVPMHRTQFPLLKAIS